MIRLIKASKSIMRERQAPLVILDSVTASIPTGQTVAIYAANSAEASALLKILTGLLRLDTGRITRLTRRISPLMNADGIAGATQFGMMTLAEQIRWYARTGRISESELIAFVNKTCDIANEWELPVYAVEWQKRRGIEIAAISSMPFECYFLDAIESIDPLYRALLFKTCELRGAGLIFSTNSIEITYECRGPLYSLQSGTLEQISRP